MQADASAFATHTVQTLLRHMAALRHLVGVEAPRLREDIGTRLEGEKRMVPAARCTGGGCRVC